MERFGLQKFLGETGLSLAQLASHLRVAETYLEAVLAGQADLTSRDQEACRLLRRRLSRAEQVSLPFAERPETFTRTHARLLAARLSLRPELRPRDSRRSPPRSRARAES